MSELHLCRYRDSALGGDDENDASNATLGAVASLLSLPSLAGDGMTEEAFAGLMQLQGQWQGTLAKSDGTSVILQLNYTSKSNGSALLEESSEDDVEMLNIFNVQEGTVVSTHYCGLMNKPVARLVSSEGGASSNSKLTLQKVAWLRVKTNTFIPGHCL